jgi:hypothetical protein
MMTDLFLDLGRPTIKSMEIYVHREARMGKCWEQAYFEKEGYFGHRNNFGEKVYFGRDLILERRPNFGMRTIDGKKEACRKRKKRSMKRRKEMWRIGRKA